MKSKLFGFSTAVLLAMSIVGEASAAPAKETEQFYTELTESSLQYVTPKRGPNGKFGPFEIFKEAALFNSFGLLPIDKGEMGKSVYLVQVTNKALFERVHKNRNPYFRYFEPKIKSNLAQAAALPKDKSAARLTALSLDIEPQAIGFSCNGAVACPVLNTGDEFNGWQLSATLGVNAPQAWQYTHGEGVIVAILSTGVDLTHADLQNRLFTDPSSNFAAGESSHGYNAFGNTPPQDSASLNSAGTTVAGVIAAQAGNSYGMSGIAPNARIMAVKTIDYTTNLPPTATIIANLKKGLDYVIKKKNEGNNIRVVVVNQFVGNNPKVANTDLNSRVQTLSNLGVLIVAGPVPLGNGVNIDLSASQFYYFPSHYTTFNNMLNVASYDYFSSPTVQLSQPTYTTSPAQSYGPNTIHIAAPGTRIVTTQIVGTQGYNYDYLFWSSNEIAAGSAAGVAALLFSAKPSLTPAQAITTITANARKTYFAANTISGGIIDAGKAVAAIATKPGDFDRNGCVDGADYILWGKTSGRTVTAGTGADGNGNGVVDAADYTIWRNNFGNGC